ncbi:MAG: polyprenyl synthetase family protein [Hyphomicrobiaceae bacterium]|nr:polyprenyl synthetase family protein [Hyphomicrobiaceae bacterium]
MGIVEDRIEAALRTALARTRHGPAPAQLAEAMEYAVLGGGARMRPRLVLAVAQACRAGPGEAAADGAAVDAAAAAIEFMHCASLVHDDLPCFDDADMRRGRPSVHRAYGEPIAVLVGDGLIVLAFETLLAAASSRRPELVAQLVGILARAVGMPHGIVAGQGWESEATIDLAAYHRAKTGALFMASAELGSAVAGHRSAASATHGWAAFGCRLGEAYQVADDLADAVTAASDTGKPAGQDIAHDRPSHVREHGIEASVSRLRALIAAAIEAIPDCPGRDDLCAVVQRETARFMPRSLAQCAA